MRQNEHHDVASLIRESTNCWYEAKGKAPIFTGDPSATMLFCDVYEALDPGCCLVAVSKRNGANCSVMFLPSSLHSCFTRNHECPPRAFRERSGKAPS